MTCHVCQHLPPADHWELYPFTADHSIERPAGFEQALEQSIRRLAGQIRGHYAGQSFQKSQDKDGLNICKLVEALDKWFFGPETDFRPAMRELDEALAAAPAALFKKEREAVSAWRQAHP